MAASAPRRAHAEEPPVDPQAVERALVRERAKRRARIAYQRELRRARRRFWLLLLGLLALVVVLAITVWDQVQSLFGI
jgi:hypothetical protein